MDTEFARGTRTRLFAPLSLAAYITWAGIGVSAVSTAAASRSGLWLGLGIAALLGMMALFALIAAHVIDHCRRPRLAAAAVFGQGLCVLAAQYFLGRGEVIVLLIIVAAQLYTMLSVPRATLALAALNLGMLWLWHLRGVEARDLVLSMAPMLGFQAFAALTAMYAERSERRGDELADRNAELLATQRLLEESTRSDERLRLSRELHDVAGHKLTAMKLNLRAMQRDPALAGREDVALCLQLADELLGDIRGVVSELREHEGIQLGDALLALARPLPGVRIELHGREQAKVATVAQAEALLRVAQEGITNALRHGNATQVALRVESATGRLRLSVEDNGRGRLPLSEGNGLQGMRERLAAFGGELDLEQRSSGGLALRAALPTGAVA